MSQDRIAFEQWWNENPNRKSISESDKQFAFNIWQACSAEANKRIAELKQDRNDLNYKCMERLHKIEELQTSNQTLREALERVSKACYGIYPPSCVEQALSATPAESLQAFENELIEKCAKVCIAKANELKELIDQDCIVGKADTGAIVCAQEIRALKKVK